MLISDADGLSLAESGKRQKNESKISIHSEEHQTRYRKVMRRKGGMKHNILEAKQKEEAEFGR
jgi:hypothetical protein